MSTDAHFGVKIGLKLQSLGKISNISAADSPVLLGQFQHCVYCTVVLLTGSINSSAPIKGQIDKKTDKQVLRQKTLKETMEVAHSLHLVAHARSRMSTVKYGIMKVAMLP